MRANAENLPFRAELDAIVASDVLEHVLNPADFLQSALEALVPGGRLLVKVPYRENISQYRRSDGCPYPMVHLRTFDRTLLRQALEDTGLRPERFSYSGFYSDDGIRSCGASRLSPYGSPASSSGATARTPGQTALTRRSAGC